ncbi:Delta(9)-fatty-acid desaturase fat-6 [Porphyridium purpureum]|uniref:Delta(9)-fatty-acid desaturase fat-6 n=1 Tax=Porphyridium purpureum TaxID=35688 RepID=A0A5J4YWQ3_PORPP|nr:Delta(9)-fatty-acid desaturase fat-6 [Porphyridium purpureum]|eukprot:POR6261..scf209_3
MAPNLAAAQAVTPIPVVALGDAPRNADSTSAARVPGKEGIALRARSGSDGKHASEPVAEPSVPSQHAQLGDASKLALAINKKLGYYTRAPISLLSMLCALIGVFVHFRLWEQVSLSMWLVAYVMGVSCIGSTMSVMLHRYFSHAAFSTSRTFQAVMAVLSCCAAQRGPVWWASKHIQHHANCDTEEDPHSPVLSGILGCVLFSVGDCEVAWAYVPKRLMLPELLLIDTFHFVPPTLLMTAIAFCSDQPLVSAFMRGALPMFFSCLMSNVFNARYHDDEESEMSTQCRAVDRQVDIMANMVGENLHAMHHTQPRLAKRSNYDLPYWLLVKPLLAVGLIWDAQYSDPAIEAAFEAKNKEVRSVKPPKPAKIFPLRVWDVLGTVLMELMLCIVFAVWVSRQLNNTA